jgi:hypothetical protein
LREVWELIKIPITMKKRNILSVLLYLWLSFSCLYFFAVLKRAHDDIDKNYHIKLEEQRVLKDSIKLLKKEIYDETRRNNYRNSPPILDGSGD